MNTLKTITTAIAILIGTSFGYAQSSAMKNPVSYTLKNGTTLIIAENQASSKTFANLSFETSNQYTATTAPVREVLTTLLNQQLTGLNTGLSYSDKGINLAVQNTNFETTLQTLYTYITTPEFNQDALDRARASVLAHLTAQDKYFPETVNEQSITNLTLADLNAYYNQISNPAQMVLTIAGNITPAVARTFAKKAIDQQKPLAGTSKTYLASNK